jgi:hypothetical protein
MGRINKKTSGFPKFLRCEATAGEKAAAMLKWFILLGTKDVVVGTGVFRITKL